jgi:chromosomal replication initiation ATPase DnaA
MKYTLSIDDVKRCRQISLGNRDLVRMIAHAVSQKTGTKVSAIYGTSRAKPAVAARHLVMYLAHKEGLSYPVIGQAMNRDHTTVMDAVKKEIARRAVEPSNESL